MSTPLLVSEGTPMQKYLTTAVVALIVVVAYDKYGKKL